MLGIFAGVLLMAGTSYAQAEKESAITFYHLDIVTKELDEARVVNTRTYSLIISDKAGRPYVVRTGSKVPLASSKGDLTYVDVGVNVDVMDVHETQGQLAMGISADISSVSGEPGMPSAAPPVIHQYKWNSNLVIPLRKATPVFSSDDPTSKRKVQIELTATPIK
jgi:hypothetical protein